MSKTKIEWADEVWNPTVGCTPVSAGCAHCYAKRMFERWNYSHKFDQPTCYPDRLNNPFRWTKPRKVFVDSMSDLFHPDIPFEFIDDVFAVMQGVSKHTFMVLTKRPERMYEWQQQYFLPGAEAPKNIWLGVSVENQKAADERIPWLLKTKAAIRFLSVEPMLGLIDLIDYLPIGFRENLGYFPSEGITPNVDWVICGGESGTDARPLHPDWVRLIKEQCEAGEIPFFFKQWGTWFPRGQKPASGITWPAVPRLWCWEDGSQSLYHVNKNESGHYLDGKEYLQYPEV